MRVAFLAESFLLWMTGLLLLAPGSRAALVEATDGPPARGKFALSARELWGNSQFETLEEMGRLLRESKAKFSEGQTKLSAFYRGVGVPTSSGENGYIEAEKRARLWMEKYPRSISAPLVLAHVQVSRAWFYRGSGYADTVTPEAWQKFGAGIARARQTLESVRSRCAVDPEWYHQMLIVARAQSWKSNELYAFFEEAIKSAPEYQELYFTQAVTLLPRWLGQPGEWEKWAEDQAAKRGAEVYTWIAWSLETYYPKEKLFTETRITWPKMKAGFEKMIKDYPDSWWNLNTYCRFACLNADRATARTLFRQIGEHWHPRAWGTPAEFNRWKKWAREPA